MLPLPPNKPLPALDARLAAAAAYVRCGSVAADIGCDHGKLSLYLAANGCCKKVIACDISEPPLSIARAAVARHGLQELVECRLGNGLSVLSQGEASDIIIAGVSGITICDILAAAPQHWLPENRFVFVPASKHEELRRWLCEHGFALLDETAVRAAGRLYTVMHTAFTGELSEPAPLFCAIGKIGAGAAAKDYLLRAAQRNEKRLQGAHEADKPAILALTQQIKEAAQKCQQHSNK